MKRRLLIKKERMIKGIANKNTWTKECLFQSECDGCRKCEL